MMKGFFVTDLLLMVIEDSAEVFLTIDDDRKRNYKAVHDEHPRIIAPEKFARDVVEALQQDPVAFKRIQMRKRLLESSVEQHVKPIAQLPTRGIVT